jgi:hypothetical protein
VQLAVREPDGGRRRVVRLPDDRQLVPACGEVAVEAVFGDIERRAGESGGGAGGKIAPHDRLPRLMSRKRRRYFTPEPVGVLHGTVVSGVVIGEGTDAEGRQRRHLKK